ncbi:MAG: aminopeptidase [Cytophagaceae bacterium]|nr:aminopeptidase [Cytophagaceae bacterium]|tara:strand:- start:2312 stop:4381 length:2070 start_codon:yes stop_codon:yes gene_type:complete
MRIFLIAVFFISSHFIAAQQTDIIDIKRVEANLDLDFYYKTVDGDLDLEFSILKDTDSIYLDAKNLVEYYASIKGKGIKVGFNEGQLILKHDFKAGKDYKIHLEYIASPDKALYFVDNEGSVQVWTQGQGKYTSNWLPSLDDMNDKIEFDLNISAPSDKVVIANGTLVKKEQANGLTTWKYDMVNPISSYLVALAAGTYKKDIMTTASGVPIELYYYPRDSAKVSATYRYTQQIFDFLEAEIMVPYPWQNYKEVPVKDFLYAGMENASATIFSDNLMVDDTAFIDRNFVNVNAHELAHQWFGDMVTETSGTHHWLQEGFATYYALLAEKSIFGEDYYYWQLYQSAEQLKELSDQGKGEKLLNPKASSLTFYQKGAWALHILREQIGDEPFRMAVQRYLNDHRYKNVSTEDFIASAEAVSGQDLTEFVKDWLNQSAFQATEALESLKKSPFMQEYLRINALRKVPLEQKQEQLMDAVTLPNDYIGQEVVYQLVGEPISQTMEIYERALASNKVMVRQAIALSLEEIPVALKTGFESLLEDESYLTKEQALMKLWFNFPENRPQYLEKTRGIAGFTDKNIETLWLALALATKDFDKSSWQHYYDRLTNYTNPSYSFYIRENAFQYLYQLQLFDAQSLGNLVLGCMHHNWRFAQSCRELLDVLVKDENWKAMLQGLGGLNKKQQEFLDKKLQ